MSLISTNSLTSEDTLETLNETQVTVPSGWFNIVGKTGLCVSARNYKGKLTQQTCGFGDDLLWTTEKCKNGLIIKNKTGRVMDNHREKGNNGNPTYSWSKNENPSQIWKIEKVRYGYVHFINLQNGKCFDDAEIVGINRTYQIWSCIKGNRNQWFRLKAPSSPIIPKGWFHIVDPKTEKCMSTINKSSIKLKKRNCGNGDDLLWIAEFYKNRLIIKNKTGVVMENYKNINRENNPIVGRPLKDSSGHFWVIEKFGWSDWVRINSQNGKCIKNIFSKYYYYRCSEAQAFRLIAR
jgi:hypothetical protein